MLGHVGALWERLNSSYWFVPTMLGIVAAALSGATLSVDRSVGTDTFVVVPLVPVVQTEGARAVLTTIATSMITVGGVVFSLMLLTLTQASSQFGPRLLVNFMRDRTNQFVLGSFIATFVYSLLVLRVVTGGDGDVGVDAFVPHLSVFVALLLAFGTVAALIYFFHHTAQSVRVTHILADVGRTLDRTLEELSLTATRPEAEDAALDDVSDHFREDAGIVDARQGGYLQEVQVERLVRMAEERGATIRLLAVVGTYVLRGAPLAEVHPVTATDAVGDEIHQALVLGEDRSLAQDISFLFDEFLEIALRALSPSMNDPFTARSCIDRIGEGMLLLDRRDLHRSVHRDTSGRIRALVPVPRKEDLAQHLFGELRHAAKGAPLAAHHLAATMAVLRRELRDRGVRTAVERELEALVEEAAEVLSERDVARLRALAAGQHRTVDPTLP